MNPGGSTILRRRGGQSQASRRIPWTYVMFVLWMVFSAFGLLYYRAFKDVLLNQASRQSNPASTTLLLTTKLGPIRIKLLENLSPSSIAYLTALVAAGECPNCKFYRSEHEGILQGILKNPAVDEKVKVVKGGCPEDLKDSKWKDNCHGPIMSHGMVGWAAGKTGPDFFVDWYKKPAIFWGAQHTVWGMIQDEESDRVMEKIWEMPVSKKGELHFLDEQLPFTLSLVTE